MIVRPDNHEETRGTSFSSDTVSSQYIQDAENTNVCMTVMTNARCNRLTIYSALTSCLLTKDKAMLPVNR